VRLVRTDIAGFAGFAERGRVAEAVRVTSWKEFRSLFGGFTRYGYLAYAVQGFFANGGTTCYVARVAAGPGAPELDRPREARFTLPQAPESAQVTALEAPSAKGGLEITVGWSRLFKAGDLIAIGEPGAVEYAAVDQVLDATRIALDRRLALKHFAGAPVSRVHGTRLSREIAAGQTDIRVDDVSAFVETDLLGITGFGVVEYVPLVAVLPGTVVRLARGLDQPHLAGDIVFRCPTALAITAASPGNWGNNIRLDVHAIEMGSSVREFSLRVVVDGPPDPQQAAEEEIFPHLSLDPKSPFFAPSMLENRSALIRATAPIDKARLYVDGGPVAAGDIYMAGGQDGLSAATGQDFIRALRALEDADEIAILCTPDAVFGVTPPAPKRPAPPAGPCEPTPPTAKPDPVELDPTAAPPGLRDQLLHVYQEMIDQCIRKRYRVAVLDMPDGLSPRAALSWPEPLVTDSAKFAAIYYPWLKTPDPLRVTGANRRIPPSGYIAGIYAQNDALFGVQRPPANLALDFVADVAEDVDDRQQGPLNDAGVNVIRALPGRGIRVWGARSLAARTGETQWWFIHARRLMSMIENSVEQSMRWTVFEVNDFNLRRTLVHALNVFLEAIWHTGGLLGASPAQGFYVKCDETNNPQTVIDAGELICEIGVAIARPMEFLVFEMRRTLAGSEVVEA
jgi:hypothetical protein